GIGGAGRLEIAFDPEPAQTAAGHSVTPDQPQYETLQHDTQRPSVTTTVSRVQNSMQRFFSITWKTTCQPSATSALSSVSSFLSGRPAEPSSSVPQPPSAICTTRYSL